MLWRPPVLSFPSRDKPTDGWLVGSGNGESEVDGEQAVQRRTKDVCRGDRHGNTESNGGEAAAGLRGSSQGESSQLCLW